MTVEMMVNGTTADLDLLRNELLAHLQSADLVRSTARPFERTGDAQSETWTLVLSFAVGIGSNAAYDLLRAAVAHLRSRGHSSLDMDDN